MTRPVPPVRVALLGAGTVGREVARALLGGGAGPGGPRFELVGVAVRDVERAAAAGIVPASLLSDAPAHLVADPGTDVVVEVMGGDEPARTLIAAALSMGKSVVTANKHVIAHHGPELEALARRHDATLRFEAAVGGGIPVLGPLALDLAGNRVSRVRGIVNGTTNVILSALADPASTIDYADALADAQARGYAEADPSGDVEGLDAVNKLVILARLAFDRWLDPATIERRPKTATGHAGPGITAVGRADQREVADRGRIIRLLATATRDGGAAGPDGGDGPIAATVLPTAVPLDSPFGRTGGVANRIEVDAEPVGRVGFDGPGAGGPATSSAVLGDLIAVARGVGSTWAGRPPAPATAEPAVTPSVVSVATASGTRLPIDD